MHLDETPAFDGYRVIKVTHYLRILRVDGLYFIRPKSLLLLCNYLREIGIKATLRKVFSRLAERDRNQKWVSLGYGQDCDSNEFVCFVAPCHHTSPSFLALPMSCCAPVSSDIANEINVSRATNLMACDAVEVNDVILECCRSIAGWSPLSGASLNEQPVRYLLDSAVDLFYGHKHALVAASQFRPYCNRAGQIPHVPQSKLRGVISGLGQYAKTCIMPNIKKNISVIRCHEIDPAQIGDPKDYAFEVTTNPRFGQSLDADVFFLAGYHHTHAPLAAEVLRAGKVAVIEKPLATTYDDLDSLLAAMDSGRLYAGFHKRYASYNLWILEDLGLSVFGQQPMDCHVIVYEVPLPRLHWYRWPNSCTRVLSNGCHWIDHFLFVNGFSEVKTWDLAVPGHDIVHIHIRLTNGAVFTFCLTDVGSERLGVREHVEFRCGDRTAILTDGGRYTAESNRRILRKKNINKMSSYALMYQEIARMIHQGHPGDTKLSVERSTRLVLDIDSEASRRLGKKITLPELS